MKTVPPLINRQANPNSPGNYAYAEYEVRPHDARKDAAFEQLRERLEKGKLKPSWFSSTNPVERFQSLLEQKDPDAVRLYELVAPFTTDEAGMRETLFGGWAWRWLEGVMMARRYRADSGEMKRAVKRAERESQAHYTPDELRSLSETGTAIAKLHEGGLSSSEYEYWASKL